MIYHKNAFDYEMTEEKDGIFKLTLNNSSPFANLPNRNGEKIVIADLDWEPIQTMRHHFKKFAQSIEITPRKKTFRILTLEKLLNLVLRIKLWNEKLHIENRHYPNFIYRSVVGVGLKLTLILNNLRKDAYGAD